MEKFAEGRRHFDSLLGDCQAAGSFASQAGTCAQERSQVAVAAAAVKDMMMTGAVRRFMMIVGVPVSVACISFRGVRTGVLVVNAAFFADRLIQGWTANEEDKGQECGSDLFH